MRNEYKKLERNEIRNEGSYLSYCEEVWCEDSHECVGSLSGPAEESREGGSAKGKRKSENNEGAQEELQEKQVSEVKSMTRIHL